MQANLETVSTLGRKMSIVVPMDGIKKEIKTRIGKLSKTVKVPGFRPGKVPLSIVEKQYGGQVRNEVLSDEIGKNFGKAIQEQNLKVAGLPKIDVENKEEDADNFEFVATFEIYPEITYKDLDGVELKNPVLVVGDDEINKTLEIMRDQRKTYVSDEKSVEDSDQVKLDFKGTIDGEPFDGGSGEGVVMTLGEGRLVADFESNLKGLKAGDSKSFPVKFPEEYPSKEVAGKEANFDVRVLEVLKPVLPELNADFAESLGVDGGDLEKLRQNVQTNVEKEVKNRIEARQKDLVMKALLDHSEFEVPTALIDEEIERLTGQMRETFRARGMDADKIPFPKESFSEEATRRVKLGLIIADLVEQHGLRATSEQIKGAIDEQAETYEKPEEVRNWYLQNPQNLRGIESYLLEKNGVQGCLGKFKVSDDKIAFDDLMGAAQ
jgi:trigger factor